MKNKRQYEKPELGIIVRAPGDVVTLSVDSEESERREQIEGEIVPN